MIGPVDTRAIFLDEFLLDTRFLVASEALSLCKRLVCFVCCKLETVILEGERERCVDGSDADDRGRVDP